ncbi:hypothetical protein MANES_03G099300v8 [Manihot esculenta]|uniref:Uncharacterized protein n=1 Tax=Manihot esculenta TaxID=3983 RepID=A0A2C9W886_MANES|nr:hypothetical protein MANES_03G099300v8 [Manihot esculenta]
MALLGSFIPKALLPSATSTRLSYYLRKAMIITYCDGTKGTSSGSQPQHNGNPSSGSGSTNNRVVRMHGRFDFKQEYLIFSGRRWNAVEDNNNEEAYHSKYIQTKFLKCLQNM